MKNKLYYYEYAVSIPIWQLGNAVSIETILDLRTGFLVETDIGVFDMLSLEWNFMGIVTFLSSIEEFKEKVKKMEYFELMELE